MAICLQTIKFLWPIAAMEVFIAKLMEHAIILQSVLVIMDGKGTIVANVS